MRESRKKYTEQNRTERNGTERNKGHRCEILRKEEKKSCEIK